MKNKVTITQLFRDLKCPLKIGYHWSAISLDNKRVVFAIWDDRVSGDEYILIHAEPSPWIKKPGGIQLGKDVQAALANGAEALGVLCHAVDPSAERRVREYFDEKALLVLELIKDGNQVTAMITGEISIEAAINGTAAEHRSVRRSAIDDLDELPEGAVKPEQLRVEGFAYKRNRMVRDHVIRRAKGRCEYCGEEGFLMREGRHYLEAHHIIGLGDNGPDTVANVIGLCPKHHREAHFGERAIELNKEFNAIINSF